MDEKTIQNLTKIIKNELATVLDRTPTEYELDLFLGEVYELSEEKLKKFGLSDLNLMIYDFRNEYFAQCEQCGSWELKDECYYEDDLAFCTKSCKEEYLDECREEYWEYCRDAKSYLY